MPPESVSSPSRKHEHPQPSSQMGKPFAWSSVPVQFVSIVSIVTLIVTKVADTLTTALGLLYVPGVLESNPVMATVFTAVGVLPGLILAHGAIITSLIVLTEGVLARIAPSTVWDIVGIRLLGYGPVIVLSSIAAVHNAAILIAHFGHLPI